MPSKIIDNAARQVGEIMNKDVHACVADVDAEAAWHHMRKAGIRHLVVFGADDALVGVISDRDLMAHETLTLARRSVRELMTTKVVVGSADTSIRDAAKLMRDHVISCLPIVSGAQVIGIITTHDLLTMIVGDGPIPESEGIAQGGRILRR